MNKLTRFQTAALALTAIALGIGITGCAHQTSDMPNVQRSDAQSSETARVSADPRISDSSATTAGYSNLGTGGYISIKKRDGDSGDSSTTSATGANGGPPSDKTSDNSGGSPDGFVPPTARGITITGPGIVNNSSGTAQGEQRGVTPVLAPPLTSKEQSFVTTAAIGGKFEVAAATLAIDHAADPAVKDFAAMLVRDHSKANDELARYAQAHGLTVPSTLPPAKQAVIDKLSAAHGAAFDHQFVQEIGVKAHRQDIAFFKRERRATQNAELKAWINKTLPTLRDHLDAAHELLDAAPHVPAT